MFKGLGILILFVIALMNLETYAQLDTVVLFRGQVFIGNIKGARLGVLTIDDNSVRIVNMKMYRIRRISATQRFKIETNSKIIYYGVLKQGKEDGWVSILLDDSSLVNMNILDINTVTALEEGFWSRLNGNLGAGFTYTKTNDFGQFNINSAIYYIGEVAEYQLSVSAIASLDSGKFSRDRENADFFTALILNPTWFAAIGFEYERNLELSIARRFQELIGGGNKLLVRKNMKLLAISGITFNQEKSTSGTTNNFLLEIPFIVRYNYFQYQKPNLQVSVIQSVFYSLTQKNRVRYGGDLNFSWELVKDFYWTINPYFNYDSKPPEGPTNSDFGVAIGLTYKF